MNLFTAPCCPKHYLTLHSQLQQKNENCTADYPHLPIPLWPPSNTTSRVTYLEFSWRGSMVILSCLPGEPMLSASARTLVDCEYCETCDEARFFSVSCGLAHHTYTTAPGKTFMTDSHEWPALPRPASLSHTPADTLVTT